jgi:hypothetical protein
MRVVGLRKVKDSMLDVMCRLMPVFEWFESEEKSGAFYIPKKQSCPSFRSVRSRVNQTHSRT